MPINDESTASMPFCPSAQPEMAGAVVFGIVQGSVETPRVAYMAEPVPVTPAVLALAGPVSPNELFRIAAPCAGGACRHFDGASCGLVTKLVQLVPPTVAGVPPCALRPTCRWWQQEGKAACQRCPQIVTLTLAPSEPLRFAADPATPLDERLRASQTTPTSHGS
jgi:hypothetical protein